jgi:hypothetical protein
MANLRRYNVFGTWRSPVAHLNGVQGFATDQMPICMLQDHLPPLFCLLLCAAAWLPGNRWPINDLRWAEKVRQKGRHLRR